MNYPDIRFRDSFLLIGAIYKDIEPAYMPPNAESDEREKLSREFINAKLDKYEQAWRPYEDKLIQGMCSALNLEFRQNIIDIYAAPFYTSFSFPLFIATKYDPDRAIEVIAHELLHVLLYDNKAGKLDLFKTGEAWREIFGDVDDEVALIHIPVHAVLQTLFDDVLGEPERTTRDKQMCENYPSYKLAWEYVDKVGYKNIIEQLNRQTESKSNA
jgi:hypothetical protein